MLELCFHVDSVCLYSFLRISGTVFREKRTKDHRTEARINDSDHFSLNGDGTAANLDGDFLLFFPWEEEEEVTGCIKQPVT